MKEFAIIALSAALISSCRGLDDYRGVERTSSEQSPTTKEGCNCDKPEYEYMSFELENFEDTSKLMHVNIRFIKEELNLYAINEVDVCITKTTNIPDGDKLLHRKTTLTLGNKGSLSDRSVQYKPDGSWYAAVNGLIAKGEEVIMNEMNSGFISIGFYPPPKGVWSVSYGYDLVLNSTDFSNLYSFKIWEEEKPDYNPPRVNKGKKLDNRRNTDCFPEE